MNREELLAAVKREVLKMHPGAEVYLFGSRARGEETQESDWDFLILLDEAPDWRTKQKIWHQLYEIEWAEGEVLSALVYGKEEWKQGPLRGMPLHQEIVKHGIAL